MKEVIFILVFIVILPVLYFYFYPTDSSDKSRWKRSGLVIYTDHKTGVQYVGAGFFGGITVRVDRFGKPMTKDTK